MTVPTQAEVLLAEEEYHSKLRAYLAAAYNVSEETIQGIWDGTLYPEVEPNPNAKLPPLPRSVQ